MFKSYWWEKMTLSFGYLTAKQKMIGTSKAAEHKKPPSQENSTSPDKQSTTPSTPPTSKSAKP